MMYLTEAEAWEKICPHMIEGKYTASVTGGRESFIQSTCLASKCMAWRWAGGLPSTEQGYCGLSGRPGPFEKDNPNGTH